MEWNLLFVFNSVLLGVRTGRWMPFLFPLPMVWAEPDMKPGKMRAIAGVFAGFQALMPMTGWICVHTIANYFQSFRKFIPWIALILLVIIGGQLLISGMRPDDSEHPHTGSRP